MQYSHRNFDFEIVVKTTFEKLLCYLYNVYTTNEGSNKWKITDVNQFFDGGVFYICTLLVTYAMREFCFLVFILRREVPIK